MSHFRITKTLVREIVNNNNRFGKCDFFDKDAGNEGIFKKVFDFRKIKALLKDYELIKDFESYKEIEDI